MHQLRLQFLQSRLGSLTLGEVADEAGEEPAIGGPHFAHRQLHGKGRAILALTDHDAAEADDSPFARLQVARKIAIVTFPIWRGHHDPDVLSDDIRGAMTE